MKSLRTPFNAFVNKSTIVTCPNIGSRYKFLLNLLARMKWQSTMCFVFSLKTGSDVICMTAWLSHHNFTWQVLPNHISSKICQMASHHNFTCNLSHSPVLRFYTKSCPHISFLTFLGYHITSQKYTISCGIGFRSTGDPAQSE